MQNIMLPLTVERIDFRSFADFKVHSYILLVIVEHMAILLRAYVFPQLLEFTVGYHAKALRHLERMLELRENASLRLLFWQNDDIKNAIHRMLESNEQFIKWQSMMALAKLQTQIGTSMNGYLWAALSLAPFLLQTYFQISWYYSLIPLFLVCCYHQSKIDRQKRGVAMSMICDPDVFQFILRELPGFAIDSDMQRCEWINTMLQVPS
jgi:hypothetical protein